MMRTLAWCGMSQSTSSPNWVAWQRSLTPQSKQPMISSGCTANAGVAQAISEIEGGNTVDVLIIEDEPLISMQLEDLVRSLGHEICGTAASLRIAAQSSISAS